MKKLYCSTTVNTAGYRERRDLRVCVRDMHFSMLAKKNSCETTHCWLRKGSRTVQLRSSIFTSSLRMAPLRNEVVIESEFENVNWETFLGNKLNNRWCPTFYSPQIAATESSPSILRSSFSRTFAGTPTTCVFSSGLQDLTVNLGHSEIQDNSKMLIWLLLVILGVCWWV